MVPDLEGYLRLFSKHGDSGEKYVREAYRRFVTTKTLSTRNVTRPLRILDVGAHWLHHCVLYAMDGHHVTAADLPAMSGENPMVAAVAREFGIEIVHYDRLSRPQELLASGAGVYDLILFTEIIEHITFNPIEMWKVLHALLKPGGRIVVTTPNYFHLTGQWIRDLGRILRGHGTGIPMREILGIHTYGHHWKIFSARDLKQYLEGLSGDFEVSVTRYFDYTPTPKSLFKRGLRAIQKLLPVFREALYLEAAKTRGKPSGIIATARW